MAFAVTNLKTDEGVHTFTANNTKYKYDSSMNIIYTESLGQWIWSGTPTSLIANQIQNAINGISYKSGLHEPPYVSMSRPGDLTGKTRVELNPIPMLTMGRIPPMLNNRRINGLGTVPVQSRVDFNKTQPIPKRNFLEDMPSDSAELQSFISDWYHTYGRPKKSNFMRRRRRGY